VSLLFLLVHIKTWTNLFVWFGSFLLSLFLGYIVIKTKNLWGAIVCHDLNDLGFLFFARQGTFFKMGG
jgi:membrane protease YdiL (CAAX protease family)